MVEEVSQMFKMALKGGGGVSVYVPCAVFVFPHLPETLVSSPPALQPLPPSGSAQPPTRRRQPAPPPRPSSRAKAGARQAQLEHKRPR